MRLQCASLFAVLVACASAHASVAEQAPKTFPVSVARQPLDEALQQLARQCGVQVVFFSRVTEGLSAPAIEGDYTLSAAMDRLLTGSGLIARVLSPQMVEVRPLQARASDRPPPRAPVPDTVRKPSSETGQPMQEVIVVGMAEQLVATRIATPLREIPQSVSIVTGEQMRERNAFILADVLAQAPGITLARSNSLDPTFFARGYQITSFHIDGGAAVSPRADPYSGTLFLDTPDLIEFDHVEILRGSDALFSGNANPGGTISLVRKRPQRNFTLAVDAEAGSWDTQRFQLDVTGPLALDGALRGRAAAVYGREGYYNDIDPHDKKKAFGALEYDLSPTATVTAGGSYQWDEAPGVIGGVPLYRDGRDSRLPRDTRLEFDWSRYHGRLSELYLQYRQELTPEWSVKLNASGWRTEAEFAYAYFDRALDPVTGKLNEQPAAAFSLSPNVHTQKTADVTLTGALNWFGWREELAVGADFLRTRKHSDNSEYWYFGETLGDPRDFDPRGYPDPRLTGPPFDRIAGMATTDQYGMFASMRVYFNDAWSVTGGARLSHDGTDVRLDVSSDFVGLPPTSLSSDYGTHRVITPYAGLMYSIAPHYSLYASYADIYLAQTTLPERNPGELLGPRRGVNIEAGIKGEWRNGALNGSLAVYRIRQSNEARRLTELSPDIDPSVPACCFTGLSSKSKGLDIELSGELARGWTLGAGYTFNENESPERAPLSTFTPKHLLKAWTNVRLPAALNRWQVGGSLLAQSRNTTQAEDCSGPTFVCGPVEGVQPSYAVLDLRAAFDVSRSWRVALNLNNVFDKVYYDLGDRMHAWYGAPRSWMLRVDGRY